MPIDRFYAPQPLLPHQIVLLNAEETHHLVKVVRARKGECVEVTNGLGILATAIVEQTTAVSASLRITDILKQEKKSTQLILAQAIPKLNRIDTIIEKGTELGVDRFIFFPGEKSIKTEISAHQLARFNAICISAMKQSGRLFLPVIELKDSLKKWEENYKGCAFYGSLSPLAPPLYELAKEATHQPEIIFFVGPESGFTKEEEDRLEKMGSQGAMLNRNILRTETASIAAMAIIAHLG